MPDRRAFCVNGTLILTSAMGVRTAFGDQTSEPVLKIGLVTDLHFADKPTAGSRHYRESPAKLTEAAQTFANEDLSFIVELGDLVDAADSVAAELGYLKTINDLFSAICEQRHYVLGNHCVTTLTKPEFLEGVGQSLSYYSFDSAGMHFVVLDACFRSDGTPYGRKNFVWTDANIPASELEWLKTDLKKNKKPTIVFAHQRLDVSNNHGVKNCNEVRAALESSGDVLAVFQGHSHKNDLTQINGIHYCTLVAMVEGTQDDSNGFSVLSVDAAGTLRLSGFRKQDSHNWAGTKR
jgi:predicted phosphodiesterase